MNNIRFPRLTFSQRLILMAVLPTVLLAILVPVVANLVINNVTRDLILRRNSSMASLTSKSVSQDLKGYLRPLEAAAEAMGQQPPADSQRMLDDWQMFLDEFEGGVTLLDAQGLAVASTPNAVNRLGINYNFRTYFQTVRSTSKPVFSSVLFEKPTGKDAVVLAVPVSRENEFGGVLIGVIFINQHAWVDEFQVLQVDQGNQSYIVDSSGTIIYHSDASQIGQNISKDGTLTSMLSAGKLLSQIAPAEAGKEERVISFAPLPDIGWNVVMEESWSALVAPLKPYLAWLSVSLILGVIFTVLILTWGLGRLVSPLAGLIQEAEHISQGDPFSPLEESGPREIRLLTGAFNQMVINLREQQASLRQYALRILQSQEEERRRISRDLHDETVQDLVGLNQRLELCRSVMVRDPSAAVRRLDELQMLTGRALADIRRMSNDLRPTILEDLGLVVAVQRLCDSLRDDMPAAQLEFSSNGNEKRLSAEAELIAFRVIQESINNIRKHARSAQHVRVELSYGEKMLVVQVVDDGPGFQDMDVDELARAGHLGLAGMVERARLMEGKLKINSQPGEGTRIQLELPVE